MIKRIASALLAGALVTYGTLAYAAEQWDDATLVGMEPAGVMLTRCQYQTLLGYRFSIVIRDAICPSWVQIDIETGRVKR